MPAPCAWGWLLLPWGHVVPGVCKALLQLWGRGVGALASPLLIAKSHRHVCGSLGTCGTPGCPELPPHRLLGSWGVQGTGEHSPRRHCKLLACPVLKHCFMSCCSIPHCCVSVLAQPRSLPGAAAIRLCCWRAGWERARGKAPEKKPVMVLRVGIAPFPRQRRWDPRAGVTGPPAQGMLRGPLGHLRARPGAAAGASRERHFLNKKEANPHVPVSASCWD